MSTVTTYDELVQRVRRKLTAAAGRDRINFLNANINSSTTTVVLADTPGNDVTQGTIIECEYERMYVRSVAGATLTVKRGYEGTTAAAHDLGDEVRIEPRFPTAHILDELIQATRALPPMIFTPMTTTLTPASSSNTFDLTGAVNSTVYRILEVWRSDSSGNELPWKNVRCRLLRNMDTAVFTSGYAVQISSTYTYSESPTLRVTYARALLADSITTSTILESAVGTTSGVGDALVWEVGARLLLEKEAERNDIRAQSESRHAEHTPPTALTQISAAWQARAKELLAEESQRLLALYPYGVSDL